MFKHILFYELLQLLLGVNQSLAVTESKLTSPVMVLLLTEPSGRISISRVSDPRRMKNTAKEGIPMEVRNVS